MPFLESAIAVFLFKLGVPVAKVFTIAKTILAVTFSALGNYAINKLSQIGRRRGQSGFQDRPRHTVTGEVVPARWVLGTARVPGVLCYFGSSGRHASMGLIISEGECECECECECIEDVIWINGDKVDLGRTPRDDDRGDVLKPSQYSKYAGYVEVYEYFKADGSQGEDMLAPPHPEDEKTEYRDGIGNVGNTPSSDTAQVRYWEPLELSGDPFDPFTNSDADLDPTGQTSEYGVWSEWSPWSVNYPPWTTEHKLDGVSWVAVKLTQTEYGQDLEKRLFTRVPNIEFLVKGIKITWPGQTTKKWTENAAALRYWWETERRGRPDSAIHQGDFTAAYDRCAGEVTVSLPSGYEGFKATSYRYTINGMVESGDDVSRVETNMDAAWAGQVIEAGGLIRFRPGGYARQRRLSF